MYDHVKTEKEILEFWNKHEIYKKLKEKNKNGEPFYFCDGPPYATGQIHPGTGWNKTIKDSICRYHSFIGKNVRAQAGYDTHGLPIEVKVEQELKFKSKNDIEKYGIEKFILKCKSFATKYIDIMGGQFKSLGIWMDFDNPYITYKDSYIDKSWKSIQMAHEKGLLHEGVYVLPYCYRCETTIANYELEYDDQTDPAIFVKFKTEVDQKQTQHEYLIVWTTTPWTLVANMGVMANPDITYVRAQVDNEVWIIAKDRLDYLLNLTQKSATILSEFSGKKLKDREYQHPFQDKIHKTATRKVVLTDEFVTVEEGSGLVHMAPGHGPADFIMGKRNHIEPFCPVDAHGNYTEEAGELKGKNVRACNPEIINILKENDMLVYEERIKHRYPHCWRCKTPLIFITTKQWFITISKIKDRMIEQIDQTNWQPAFAKERFREFVQGAPDWCISRQRYWGIPLPIWKCESCKKIKVIGGKDELPQKQPLPELHRPHVDNIHMDCECGEKMSRIPDVLDVWFDSGNAVWAILNQEEAKTFGPQADLIVEGQDQIRGWFYSLLGSGIVRYDACPYKNILMHGFFVDEKGEKMSKSLGNFVPLEQILEKHGADSFRLWGCGNSIWEELKFSVEEMKKCKGDLNIALNMIMFLQRFYAKPTGNEHTPSHPSYLPNNLTELDKWMLSRLNSSKKKFHEAFQNLEINMASKTARELLVEDLSRFYMKIAKERISKQENDEGALYVIYSVTFECLKMLGCFSPLICEKLYQMFYRAFEKEESLFLHPLTSANEGQIDISAEKQIEVVKAVASASLLCRQKAQIKVRWPIRTLFIETKSHEAADAISRFKETIITLVNSKEIELTDSTPKGEIASEPFSLGTLHMGVKIDEELYEEAMVNEIKRRVQMIRKEMNLVEADEIIVYLQTEKELEAIIKNNEPKLLDSVNSKKIVYSMELDKPNEYEIDGRNVKIALKKK